MAMRDRIKMGKDANAKLRKVLNANPDLPVILLTENGPDDYFSYYHEGISVSITDLLFGSEVPNMGLDDCRIYDDSDDVAECIAEALYDSWVDAAIWCAGSNRLEELLGFDAADFADKLADAMARDGMPWEKYVLVRAWL
jgi:hypothetical protein